MVMKTLLCQLQLQLHSQSLFCRVFIVVGGRTAPLCLPVEAKSRATTASIKTNAQAASVVDVAAVAAAACSR